MLPTASTHKRISDFPCIASRAFQVLTVKYSDRDGDKALFSRSCCVGRLKTEHEDPWDIIEAHEIHPSKRSISL
jgi:hypothetical protein